MNWWCWGCSAPLHRLPGNRFLLLQNFKSDSIWPATFFLSFILSFYCVCLNVVHTADATHKFGLNEPEKESNHKPAVLWHQKVFPVTDLLIKSVAKLISLIRSLLTNGASLIKTWKVDKVATNSHTHNIQTFYCTPNSTHTHTHVIITHTWGTHTRVCAHIILQVYDTLQ